MAGAGRDDSETQMFNDDYIEGKAGEEEEEEEEDLVSPGGSVEAEVGAASGECVVSWEAEDWEGRTGLKYTIKYFTGPQISWEASHISKSCGKC